MNLSIENSWWFEGGLWQDPDLAKVRDSFLDYHPRPISPVECESGGVLTLRGPRRAGKTVTLKLLVAQLVEEAGWPGRHVGWTSFDTLRTMAQAEQHLREIAHAHPQMRLLVVDETTSVLGWKRVIKKLRDDGTLGKITLILTGSSAFDLKAGAERMAGRRGTLENPDRVLLPMSFRDFAQQLAMHGHAADARTYLEVGGFPYRVDTFLRANRDRNPPWDRSLGLKVLDDIVFYEITRRRLDRNIALELFWRLSQIQTSATSLEALAKPMSVTRETARKYLNALGDAFLLATISSFDTSRNRVAPRKDRKFLWIDSALGFLAETLGQGDAASEPARAEWAVGAELLRRYELRLFEGLSAPRQVFTWKSSGGNEVDFLVYQRAANFLLPVEVKYQKSIADWDFQVMERAFRKGILVTPEEDRIRPHSRAQPLAEFLRDGPATAALPS